MSCLNSAGIATSIHFTTSSVLARLAFDFPLDFLLDFRGACAPSTMFAVVDISGDSLSVTTASGFESLSRVVEAGVRLGSNLKLKCA